MVKMRIRGLAVGVLLCALLALVIAGFAQPGNEAREERLQRLRTLGKAYYENPTTQNEAVEQFRLVVEMNPDSVVDRLNYGLALLRAGKVQEGIRELEEVQKKDPSIPHTWFNLGIEYKRLGEAEKAIRQLEQMARLVPDEPITHYNLGVL
jgi:tetratricopeptide (TPR) repeat protein